MFGKEKGSLVAQLQKEVVDSGVPISDILRKAKILASQLKNKEFKRWIDAELKGYDNTDNLPDYRKFTPINLGTFTGSFGKVVNNVGTPRCVEPFFWKTSTLLSSIKYVIVPCLRIARFRLLEPPFPRRG